LLISLAMLDCIATLAMTENGVVSINISAQESEMCYKYV
jgi:hypothetical protein